MPRQQGFDFVDRMSVSDFGKDIFQIGFWIYVVELCRLDESVDSGGALAARI